MKNVLDEHKIKALKKHEKLVSENLKIWYWTLGQNKRVRKRIEYQISVGQGLELPCALTILKRNQNRKHLQ